MKLEKKLKEFSETNRETEHRWPKRGVRFIRLCMRV